MERSNEATKNGERGSDWWRVLLGVGISAGLLGIVFFNVDSTELKNELLRGDYRFLLLSILSFLASLLARTVAWRALLENKASPRRVFLTLNEGYFLNNVLPFRLGEVGRAFLLSRNSPLRFWQIVPTIMIERAFDMLLVVSLLFVSLPFVVGVEGAAFKAAVVGGVVLLALAGLHLLARSRVRVLGWIERLQARFPALQRLRSEQIEAFFQGLSALTDLRRFLVAFGGMLAAWVLIFLYYYLALLIFVPQAHWAWAGFSLSMVGLGVAVPSAPGQIGVVEAGLVFVLGILGVWRAKALAYALVVHAIYLLFTSLLGIYALSLDGQSLASVYRQIRERSRGVKHKA